MGKKGFIWLVAIIILTLRVPTLMAQTDITDVVVTPKFDADKKNWTIYIVGKTRLDKDDKSAQTLTFVMTDPNKNLIAIPAANISWTKPDPGKTTAFGAFSDPVTVTGMYDLEIKMSYVDSNNFPKIASSITSFEVK